MSQAVVREPAVVLIDGEHYPPVVTATIAALAERYEVRAALFLGGEEKLRAANHDAVALAEVYGLPVTVARSAGARADLLGMGDALASLLEAASALTVVDLSDEPVLGYRERFHLISVALARGARYVGADFEFSPQSLKLLSSKPSLAVIGTGKRVGKTAVSGFIARRLAEDLGDDRVAIVAMGRGGPPEPQVVRGAAGFGAAELLGASRAGLHAASDYFEDAVLAGVTTIGCRRCGGGMAGAAYDSNVGEALGLAEELPGAVVIWEGSGSVIPPVRAQGVVCVASAGQTPEYMTGYLGTYRMLISDLIILTMCEPPFASSATVDSLVRDISALDERVEVVRTVFRPRPVESIAGERVAYFTTAAPESLPSLSAHLASSCGADVVLASGDLAHRARLSGELARAAVEADVFVTEIKAAAIDAVAEAAAAHGKRLVFCDNEPVPLQGDLTAAVDRVWSAAQTKFREETGWSTTAN